MATTAKNLEHLRDMRRLSNAEVCQLLNIGPYKWADILSGKQKPSRPFLEKVATTFDTTVEELLGDELAAIFKNASQGTTPEKLKALEHSYLYQHSDMAAIIDKSVRTWSAYLEGSREVPRDVLNKLAKHFHLSVEDLTGSEPQEKKQETKAPETGPKRRGRKPSKQTAEQETQPKAPKAQKAAKEATEAKEATDSPKQVEAKKATDSPKQVEAKEATDSPKQEKAKEEVKAPKTQKARKETKDQPKAPSEVAQQGTSLHFRLHIQSQSGQSILAQALLDILPADAQDVYIKAEEGKAYWAGNGRTGSINLW